MPKSAFATFRIVEDFHLDELGLLMPGYDHLGNALAVVHHKRFLTKVDEYDANLASIVGIYRARGVDKTDAMLQRQPATGTYLRLVASGQSYAQAGRNQTSFQGTKRDGFVEIGTQIHACRLGGCISRQLVMRVVNDANFHDLMFNIHEIRVKDKK